MVNYKLYSIFINYYTKLFFNFLLSCFLDLSNILNNHNGLEDQFLYSYMHILMDSTHSILKDNKNCTVLILIFFIWLILMSLFISLDSLFILIYFLINNFCLLNFFQSEYIPLASKFFQVLVPFLATTTDHLFQLMLLELLYRDYGQITNLALISQINHSLKNEQIVFSFNHVFKKFK